MWSSTKIQHYWPKLSTWFLSSRHISKAIVSDPERIRNIGLVAHIDAGKTTTTERMLYYSGSSEYMGEVHHGDTVMDYMEQERERGITITMAAATIRWLGFNINLLDTPGHIDFTFEVERSLSVLDGAVMILDSSVGVQAQTIKVWQQMNRYQIPSVFYANKMDKQSASVNKCLNTIEKKLGIEPLLLQKPIIRDSVFIGIIDLVNGIYLEWPLDYKNRGGREQFHRQSLLPNMPEYDQFLNRDLKLQYQDQLQYERENLISKLSDYDEQFADYILSLDNVTLIEPSKIITSIRSLCLDRRLSPLLLGSSYRNIGVQQLLDSICYYLPKPIENKLGKILFEHYTRNQNELNSLENFCALAFKIHYHRRLGLLTYLRIYSGTITSGMLVFNINRQSNEKIVKIYKPFADNFVELTNQKNFNSVLLGDIVVVSGLCSTITGDTLVYSSLESKLKHEHLNKFHSLLAGIEIPDPVYYCSLECPSLSKMKQLELALNNLQKEDPSFKVTSDQNTQQFIIKGMGELHIEIIKDRIKREYDVDVETGPLQISYKETIMSSRKETLEQSKTIGGKLNQIKITLEVKPKSNFLTENNLKTYQTSTSKNLNIKIINTKERNLSGELMEFQLNAIYSGVAKALENGPLSFPVVGVDVSIYDFEATKQTSPAFITNITSQCMLKALHSAQTILMEPIMRVEIVTPEQFVGPIISDLSCRRSQLLNIGSNIDKHAERYILAYVPLEEMLNYSNVLRTISSGMASFDINIHSYKPLDKEKTAELFK